MKKLRFKHPVTFQYSLTIILFVFALFVSVLLNRGLVKQYFPYTAPLLLVLATWLVYKKENKSLNAIGLNFSLKNLSFLPIGVLVGALTFFCAKYFRALYLGETFKLSASIDYTTILYAFYFILPQVATEELLFRGYLFKKTTQVFNVVVANILFSILFMLIHVLDDSVLSNMGKIIMLVIAIPVGHLLFATALLKSRTLYFPIGLHLGNNWATRHLINSNNTVDSIFYVPNTMVFEAWTPFIVVLVIFNSFFLLVTFIIWKWDTILKVLQSKKLV